MPIKKTVVFGFFLLILIEKERQVKREDDVPQRGIEA
jgi:hypothetical protein